MFNVIQLIVIHHLRFSDELIDLRYLSIYAGIQYSMCFSLFSAALRRLWPRLHPTHCQRPSHCFLPQSYSVMAISWPFTFNLVITSPADKGAYKIFFLKCWIDWFVNLLSHDCWVMVLHLTILYVRIVLNTEGKKVIQLSIGEKIVPHMCSIFRHHCLSPKQEDLDFEGLRYSPHHPRRTRSRPPVVFGRLDRTLLVMLCNSIWI